MVWVLVFVLVTTGVAETWDTGMRFDNLEDCRRAGGSLYYHLRTIGFSFG